MKITSLELHNFKRFSHLKLTNIPDTARLVLLIGSNGSGKSSVFDAFEALNKAKRRELTREARAYYRKELQTDYRIGFATDQPEIGYQEVTGDNSRITDFDHIRFYGRTSFRQVPRLTRTNLGSSTDTSKDTDRPRYFIDRDERFENDIEKITQIILQDIFRTPDAQTKVKERFLDPINRSLERIFGQQNGSRLELLEIIPPLEGNVAQVTFKKGKSEFHYNQLSAGEKEVINLLINFSSRRDLMENAICFFDEIDLHLNTKLQHRLLQEMVENWLPPDSQLWTASHSLGFIEYAQQSQTAVIIDFDDLDFDEEQVLEPIKFETPDVYEIAVPKTSLAAILGGRKLCFVENKDKELYSLIGLDQYLFAYAQNKQAVYYKSILDEQVLGIIDRDFLTDEDRQVITQHHPNLFILPYYSIENLLYHPDNLSAYYEEKKAAFDKAAYIALLTAEKESVADQLAYGMAMTRTTYPFFSEPKFSGSSEQKRFKNQQDNLDQVAELSRYLKSTDFERWYSIFPMKTYATTVPHRQNIRPADLCKTPWFKLKITEMFERS